MGLKTRRKFLQYCAASIPALASAHGLGRIVASQNPYRTPETLDRYIDPLRRLNVIHPSSRTKAGEEYHVRMRQFERPLHSQLPPTRLWGFECQYPGPVFEARQGKPIVVHWENQLPVRHLFKIDPHIHGAIPPAPAVRTVPHLHGARTPSASDGLPEKWFTPGNSARYFYPNDQQAATLWYHDHALGITRLNVYAGLSGFYLLRDENESRMQLPTGDFEVPLLLQDRALDDGGQLIYTPTFDTGEVAAPGVWAPEFFGSLPVVNGGIYPYLDVEPCRYRLRVLNSCNSRFLHIYFNLAKNSSDIPRLAPCWQIGTDGGFLGQPVKVGKVLLGPAERADLMIDFTGLEGQTVTLMNDAESPYPGWALLKNMYPQLNEWMQFRVKLPASARSKAFSFPPVKPLPVPDPKTATVTRNFDLTENIDAHGRSLGMHINSKGYDNPVSVKPKLGATEIWRFINNTEDAHPMHLHLVQFRILARQGFNGPAYSKGRLELLGRPRPPLPNEAGWKDTAVVAPGETLTILVQFLGFTGRYVFHCHMLEHEDNDMMRPYEVVEASS
ncbi:MAG: multicopper oxidase [Acidobacteriaceae bacterium]